MDWPYSEERAGIAPASEMKEVVELKQWQKGIALCLLGAMLTLAGCTSSPKAQQPAPEQETQPKEQVEL